MAVSIELNWTDNSNDEEGFFVQRALSGTGPWATIGTVGGNVTTFTDADPALTVGTEYFYRVFAFNDEGNSAPSNVASVTPTVSTLTEGLIHWWEMDEASGTRADSVGSFDLSEIGGTVDGRDVIGGDGAEFTGSSSNFLSRQVGDAVPTSVFTIAAWAEADVFSGVYNMIATYNNRNVNTLTGAGWWFGYFSSGSTWGVGYADGSSNFQEYTGHSFGTPSTGTSYLVAAHIDMDLGTVGISINGAPWQTAATTRAAFNTGTLFDFVVGHYKTFAAYEWDGGVARLGYWNRKLTDQELSDLYNGGAGLTYSQL